MKLTQQEKSTILARNLRALEPEDAEKLLVNVYASVGEALRRVSTQTKVLLDVTSSMQPAEPKSPAKSLNMSSMNEELTNGAAKAHGASMQEELSQALAVHRPISFARQRYCRSRPSTVLVRLPITAVVAFASTFP